MGVLALTACHSPQREARQMVCRAERLADTLPDSTASLIDSVLRMPVYFNEKHRMDMALLQAEALFGDHGQEISPLMDDDFFDDKPTLSTSPELERAAAYYAKKKNYDKAAHAALYSGFVQQHYNDKTSAMQSFKDAEHYGGLAGDSLTVAWAQYKMGNLLYYDGLVKESLTLLKKSRINFSNHYADCAIAQNSIACCYLLQGLYDSTEICLQQGLIYANEIDSYKIRHKILNNFAVLYRLQGKHDQSIACLRQMANDPNLSDTEETILCLNLGNSFIAFGKMDSAIVHYQHLEEKLPVVNMKTETKASVYSALSHFAEKQNNLATALQYREKHEKLLYELMVLRQDQAVYRIQQQYDYETMQNALNKKIILRHRIILIISILLFIAAIIILVLQYRHKQLLKAEEEMKRQIDVMKQDLRQSVKSSIMDEEVALRLRMILTANRTAKRAKDFKNEWQPLVIQVMNGKENLFDAARATVELAYPNLYAILGERHPNLTETEAKVCLLSFCDLSNAEIAELLGLKPNTVNQNRSTLRKKLNLDFDKMKEQMRDVLAKNA
jgi:DNA-binding CsgD family transcriptional regulator